MPCCNGSDNQSAVRRRVWRTSCAFVMGAATIVIWICSSDHIIWLAPDYRRVSAVKAVHRVGSVEIKVLDGCSVWPALRTLERSCQLKPLLQPCKSIEPPLPTLASAACSASSRLDLCAEAIVPPDWVLVKAAAAQSVKSMRTLQSD